MDQNLTDNPVSHQPPPLAEMPSPQVDVLETSAAKGEWVTPASKKVSLALALSNFSARWRTSRGFRSEDVSAGTIAICEFNSRQFEMRNPTKFGMVLMQNELLEQAGEGTRYTRPELRTHDVLQDLTLRHLMEVLLREKQVGFQSGLLFLDSIATALANYVLRHYSTASPALKESTGGLAPAVLRRCIEFINTRLEGNLRLSDLAHEAKVSTPHLIRSFRQSTGKTPYQFLLHQRVERARSLMSDPHIPLTQVALASGFADQHHLARVFRRVTGLTPSSYRRSL